MPLDSVDLMGAMQDFFTKEFEKGDPAASQAAGFVLAFELFPITLAPEECLLDEVDPESFVPARQQEIITRRVVDHATLLNGAYRLSASDWMSDTYSMELVGPARYRADPDADPAAEAEAAAHFAVVRSKAQQEFRTVVSVMGQPDEYAPSDALPADWLDMRQNDNWQTYSFSASAAAPGSTPPATPTPTPKLAWRALDAKVLATRMGELEGAAPATGGDTAAGGKAGGVQVGGLRFPKTAANIDAIHAMAGSHKPVAAKPAASAAMSARRATRLQGLFQIGRGEDAHRRIVRDGLFHPVKRDVFFDRKMFEARAELAVVLADAVVQTPPAPATDNIHVQFQYQVVRLDRPWIFFPFLRHANWYVPGMAAGAISNPAAPETPGRMGLVPTALLVIRDLSITANWNEHDVAELDKSFALGPFGKGVKAEIVGGVLKCDGVQIIGCISERMPLLPPRSDPRLEAVA